jgi:hypothetical protein
MVNYVVVAAVVYLAIGAWLAVQHVAHNESRGRTPGSHLGWKLMLLVIVWGPWMLSMLVRNVSRAGR